MMHYYIQTFPQPDPIQSHLNQIHGPLSTSWNNIKIILLSNKRLGLPSGLFPLEFPTKILYTSLLSPIVYLNLPILSSSFDHPNNIRWYIQIVKLINM